MFNIFRRQVGAKIILGYLASVSLMVIIGVLVAVRLTQVTGIVNDLTNNQAVELDLSNAIANQIVLVQFYANRYIQNQDQSDLDAFRVSFSQLQALLVQAEQKTTASERAAGLQTLRQALPVYGAAFDEITDLLRQRARIRSEVIETQDINLGIELAALRVSPTSGSDPTLYLVLGNVQTDYQNMRLNVLKYILTGEDRFVALFELNYQDAQEHLADLNKTLTTPTQRQNSADMAAAFATYARGFKEVQAGYTRLRELQQTKLDTLGPEMSQAAFNIAAQVKQEFQNTNAATQSFVVQTQVVLLAAILSAIVIGLWLGWVISRRITTPLRQVAQAAQQIANVDIKAMSSELVSLSQGKLALLNVNLTASPLEIKLADEVGQMGQSFNQIILSLRVAEQAFHAMTVYLNEMAGAAQNVAQGNLDVNVTVHSPEDVLGNALAHMVANLRAAEAKLRQYQENLEELVRARTTELTATNQRLLHEATERERAEKELRAREHELHMITDNIPVFIGYVDAELRYRFVNQRYIEAFGLNAERIIGKHVRDVLGEAYYRRAESNINAALAGQEVSFESTMDMPRLGLRWLSVNYVPEVTAPGAGGGVYIMVLDITERKQAEEAIRQSEENFRKLFDANPFPIAITRMADGFVIQANQAVADYLELSPANQPSMRTIDYYARPVDRQTLLNEIKIDGRVTNKVIEFKTAQSQSKFALVNMLPLVFSGEACLLVGLADITERKRIEDELHALNYRFELYLKYIPIMMYAKDADTRAIIMSRHFEQLLGKPISELLGKTNAELWPPEFAEPMTLDDECVIKGNETVMKEETFAGRYYYTFKFPIKEPGQPPLLGGYSLDITELKQTQVALQESEARMRQITAAMRQAVWLRDTRTLEVLYVNPAYEAIWGQTCESLYADPTSFTQAIYPEDKERIFQAIQKQYQGVFFNQEYRITRPDGSLRWVWGRTFPIKNEQGEVHRILAVVEDITERKQMEEALVQAKDAAEAANRAKSAFLANMSHELRTPLNAVLGFAQLMARSPTIPPEHRDNLGIIITSGEHLLTMINQVLDLSKIEAGHLSLEETDFNLHRLLDDLAGMFQLRAADKSLHLVIDQDPTIPPSIRTDEVKLRQVLINLLSNAVKFTKEGSVTLRVRLKDAKRGGRMKKEETFSPHPSALILFEIEDTGPGIAPDELATIFDAFTQTQTGRQAQEGTGLGLAISQRFVRLLGGDLTTRSEVGQGTIFSFDIPVKVIEAGAAPVPARSPARRVVSLVAGQPTYRLLVVDDKAHSRQVLVKLLAPLGFDMREAANGQEAIEVWAAWQPHLIWMDMRMPVLDGYEATRRIKASPQGQSTLIIAATASAFEEDRAQILAAGCNDFIRKPVREAEIFEVLARRLGVQFVYEETQPALDSRRPQLEDLRAALQGLPVDLLTALKKAAIQADMEMIDQLLDQIRSHAPDMADELAALADDFEYHAITALLQEV